MNKKILILDDQEKLAFIDMVSSTTDYQVDSSFSISIGPTAAINIYHNYDLIICDIDLGGGENGFQFWDQIKDTYKGKFFFWSGLAGAHAPEAEKRNVSIYPKSGGSSFFIPIIKELLDN